MCVCVCVCVCVMSKTDDKMLNTTSNFQEPQKCVTTRLILHWGIPMYIYIAQECCHYLPKQLDSRPRDSFDMALHAHGEVLDLYLWIFQS